MTLQERYETACKAQSDIGALLPVLYKYAQMCAHVTEFGIRDGNSTTALLYAKPSIYNGYDIQTNPNHDILAELGYGNGTVTHIFYADTSKLDDIKSTHLLFIDSLHTDEQVRAELKHHERVSKYLIFHDTEAYGEHGELPGSKGICQAIQDVLGGSGQWEMIEERKHCNGMQVWSRVL